MPCFAVRCGPDSTVFGLLLLSFRIRCWLAAFLDVDTLFQLHDPGQQLGGCGMGGGSRARFPIRAAQLTTAAVPSFLMIFVFRFFSCFAESAHAKPPKTNCSRKLFSNLQ